MSVTFYDPENPTKYNDEYEIVGGGPEANFGSSNARMLIDVLGLDSDPSLYGEISAEHMIEALDRADLAVMCFCKDEDTKGYLHRSFDQLRRVAQESLKHGKKIVWG